MSTREDESSNEQKTKGKAKILARPYISEKILALHCKALIGHIIAI